MSAPPSPVRPDTAVAASPSAPSDGPSDNPSDGPSDEPGPGSPPPSVPGAASPIRIGLDLGARWITLCAQLPDDGSDTGPSSGNRLVGAALAAGREPLRLGG